MAFYLIAPENIQTILSEKRAVLIDVREREEYLEEHYGNARNCPYENIDTWMNYFSEKQGPGAVLRLREHKPSGGAQAGKGRV